MDRALSFCFCQGLLRLDGNQPLHVADLMFRKENIGNVDFLLSGACCDQEKVLCAKPETIAEKVGATLLEQHPPCIVALLTAADQMFLCELARAYPPKNKAVEDEKPQSPNDQEQSRKRDIESAVHEDGKLWDKGKNAIPPAQPGK